MENKQQFGVNHETGNFLEYLDGFKKHIRKNLFRKMKISVFCKGGFDIKRKVDSGVYELTLKFKA